MIDTTVLLAGIVWARSPLAFLNEVMGWSHEELDRIKRRSWADLTP